MYDVDSAMASWTSNAQDDDALPAVVLTSPGGSDDWAEAMTETDEAAVAVVTPESTVFIKGNLIVIAALTLSALVVLLGVVVYFGGKFGTLDRSDEVL